MADWRLSIVLDRPQPVYHPGEKVSGQVRVFLEDASRCRALRLRRYWQTHGKGTKDRGAEDEVTLHVGPLPTGGTREIPFEIRMPSGPFTYHGHHLNVDHYLEAEIDVQGGRDRTVTRTVALEPGEGAGVPVETLTHSTVVRGNHSRRTALAATGMLVSALGLYTLPATGPWVLFLGLGLLAAGMWRRVARMKLGIVDAQFGSRVIVPGGSFQVRAGCQPSRRTRIRGARVKLEAKESCVSGSGSDRRTHAHVVFSHITRLRGSAEIDAGQRLEISGTVQVPETRAYSFASEHNRLTWRAWLYVDIPGWPDWMEEAELLLWPEGPVRARSKSSRGGRPRRQPAEVRRGGGRAAGPHIPPHQRGPSMEEPQAPERTLPARVEAMDPTDGTTARDGEPHDGSTGGTAGPDQEPHFGPVSGPTVAEKSVQILAESGHRIDLDGVSISFADAPLADAAAGGAPHPGPATVEGPRTRSSATSTVSPAAAESGDVLVRRLAGIRDANRFRGEREPLIRELRGHSFLFEMAVEEVQATFGSMRELAYRSGRTATGTVAGTDLPVAVRFPDSRNGELESVRRGDTLSVQGTVVDWQRLYDRPDIRADA